ncbi:hypothetical protein Tco_1330987 [Tanacetum coccineum]
MSKGLQKALYIAEVLDLHLVLLWRDKAKSKSQPSILFVLLWSQSQPLKILGKGEVWEQNKVRAGFGIGGRKVIQVGLWQREVEDD